MKIGLSDRVFELFHRVSSVVYKRYKAGRNYLMVGDTERHGVKVWHLLAILTYEERFGILGTWRNFCSTSHQIVLVEPAINTAHVYTSILYGAALKTRLHSPSFSYPQ